MFNPIQTLLAPTQPSANAAQGGATEDQIAELRRYAEALRAGKQPVRHWLQGVSNVAADVMSGYEANKADQMRNRQQQDYISALGGGGNQAPVQADTSTDAVPSAAPISSGGGSAGGTGTRPSGGPEAERAAILSGTWKPAPDYQAGIDSYKQSVAENPALAVPPPGGVTGAKPADLATVLAAIPGGASAAAGGAAPGVRVASLPPSAQTAVDVLAGGGQGSQGAVPAPAGPQVAAPSPGPAGAGTAPQDQVRQMAVGLIRAGMAPAQAITTAAGMVQARQGFLPQHTVNDYGQIVRAAPGQMPQIVGQMPGHPGKPTSMFGMQGFETIGANGVPKFTPTPIPSFGTQGGAPATGQPGSNGAPPGAPALASGPGAAPSGTSPGPPPLPTTADEARTYQDRMAAWKAGQTKSAEEEALLAAKRSPAQQAAELQQIQEKERARIAADTSPEAIEGGARKVALTEQAKEYVKKQQMYEKQAADSQAELPQLNLLKRVIAVPEFYSGIFSKQVGDIKQIADKIGLQPNQTATLMQFAKKLGAAGSLEQIREMGQQGAVRVPEMHMIEKSNFDPENTQESNAAVVEIRARLAQRSMEIADMANKYADAHGGLIDRKFDQQVRDTYRDKPLIQDEELTNFNTLLDRKKPASTERLKALPPGFQIQPPPAPAAPAPP